MFQELVPFTDYAVRDHGKLCHARLEIDLSPKLEMCVTSKRHTFWQTILNVALLWNYNQLPVTFLWYQGRENSSLKIYIYIYYICDTFIYINIYIYTHILYAYKHIHIYIYEREYSPLLEVPLLWIQKSFAYSHLGSLTFMEKDQCKLYHSDRYLHNNGKVSSKPRGFSQAPHTETFPKHFQPSFFFFFFHVSFMSQCKQY